jgi:hypothetical protein
MSTKVGSREHVRTLVEVLFDRRFADDDFGPRVLSGAERSFANQKIVKR